jgi:predicted Zn-dependent protease
VGFFGGYLLTRLFLAGAFEEADRRRARLVARKILTEVPIAKVEKGRKGPSTPSQATEAAAEILTSRPGAGVTGTSDQLLADARAFKVLNKPDMVETALRKARDLRPNDTRIKYDLALHLLFNIDGREMEAIPLLEDVVKSPDCPAEAWKMLGQAYLWGPDETLTKGADALERYLKLYPQDTEAILWLTAAHARLMAPDNPSEKITFLAEVQDLIKRDPNMKQRIRDEAYDGEADDFRRWRQDPDLQPLIGPAQP